MARPDVEHLEKWLESFGLFHFVIGSKLRSIRRTHFAQCTTSLVDQWPSVRVEVL